MHPCHAPLPQPPGAEQKGRGHTGVRKSTTPTADLRPEHLGGRKIP